MGSPQVASDTPIPSSPVGHHCLLLRAQSPVPFLSRLPGMAAPHTPQFVLTSFLASFWVSHPLDPIGFRFCAKKRQTWILGGLRGKTPAPEKLFIRARKRGPSTQHSWEGKGRLGSDP